MKRCVVEYRIIKSLEFEFLDGINSNQLERLALAAIKKDAVPFASDIDGWEIVDIENDQDDQ